MDGSMKRRETPTAGFFQGMRGFSILLVAAGLAFIVLNLNPMLGLATLAVGALLFFGSVFYSKSPKGPSADEEESGEDEEGEDSDGGDDGGSAGGDGDGDGD